MHRTELANWLSQHGLPPELVVLLFAMVPIFELRGALPVAHLVFSFPVWKAYLISVIGNLLPVLPILVLLNPTSQWLTQRFEIAQRFFDWLFDRTRRRTEDKVKKYGPLGLMLFVAIPLPITGAWTGCVAAFVFGIGARRALGPVTAGVLIAGVVVSVLTYGIATIAGFF